MSNEEMMEFTGERFVPDVTGNIVLEHLHRYLQAREIAVGKIVLDIASGEGYGSAILAEAALSVTGVDISLEAVAHARQRYCRDNLQYVVGDCAQIPLPDASVDLVVSFETIEHHDRHEEMLLEIKRVLRKDGVLLISSPDKKYYSDELNYSNPYHVKELYGAEFEELIGRHFRNAVYFGQRIVYGSALVAKAEKSAFVDFFMSKDETEQTPHLQRPVYWVALATDGQLPDLASGILEQPIGETEVVEHFNHAVMLRDKRVGELAHELSTRKSELTTVTEELAASLQQAAAQDRHLINLQQQLNEKNSQLDSLAASSAHYRQKTDDLSLTLEQMLASTSWRVTAPLRVAGSGLHRLTGPVNRLRDYLKPFRDSRKLKDCPLFDSRWYLSQYPDLQQISVSPLRHYLVHGWKEGRNPGPEFDGAYYRNRYPDTRKLDEAPLVHYWIYGRFEGRHINAALDFAQPPGENFPGDDSSPISVHGQSGEPLISVVIPTYNRLAMLPQLIESWRKVHVQTRISFEIIFSDDGSTDGTLDYLESVGDLPLIVLKNVHGGASAARNSGIQAAVGRRILLMGDDIFPDPEIVNVHASLAQQLGAEVAILGFVDWHPELATNHLMRHITNIGNEQFSYNRLEDNSFTDFRHFYTCNISIDRHFLLREKRLFDESFNEYGFEDIELGYRLARRGLKIFYSSLPRGDHYHPYTIESFCRRQISSGKMALVFARIHPGVEPILGIPALRKLSERTVSKEEDAAWQRYAPLLQQRCHFYEHLAETLPPGLSTGIRSALSEIYCRYFKAMFEYSVLREISSEEGSLTRAMRNNFGRSWDAYWPHIEAHQPPEDLSAAFYSDLLHAASVGDALRTPLDSQSRALFDEFIFLLRRGGGDVSYAARDQFPASYFFRRFVYHLTHNPRHLLGRGRSTLAAWMRRPAPASMQTAIRHALPGLVLESGHGANDAVMHLFRSAFGSTAPVYEYTNGPRVVARADSLAQPDATVFFWPDPAEPLPMAAQLLTAYIALIESGLSFSLISNALESGGTVSVANLRNHLLFSSDVAAAVFSEAIRDTPFNGKILRLLPASHTRPKRSLEELMDAQLQVDGEGRFSNRTQQEPATVLYGSEYLPRHTKHKPVVFVLPIFLAVGGVERNTVEIMRQLRDRFDFVVITMERLRPEQGSLAAQALEVAFNVIEMAEAVDHRSHLRVLAELKRCYQPDIVWVCNGSPWFCDNAMALRMLFSDVPIIDQKVYDTKEGWISRHQEAGTMSFDRFIAVNKKIAQRFQADFRIDPDRIDLIYSAVDVARINEFKANNAGVEFFREKFQLPASKKIFTFIGRLTPQKQPLEFLKLAKARLARTDEYYVLVGDGELSQAASAFIEQHALTNVKRIHYVENTLELHTTSSGIIFTSAYEGLPIAMIEALAMGVPAFSTDVGDIGDVLAQYDGGEVYATGTATSELNRLFQAWLFKREDYAANLRAREADILRRFSSKVISEQYVESWQLAAAMYGKKIGEHIA